MLSLFSWIIDFFLLPFSAPEFDVSEIETLFSATVPKSDTRGGKSGDRRKSVGSKPDKVHLVMKLNLLIVTIKQFCCLLVKVRHTSLVKDFALTYVPTLSTAQNYRSYLLDISLNWQASVMRRLTFPIIISNCTCNSKQSF